jgi:hypothetical protein
MPRTLGFILTTYDGDEKFFDQILGEFTRLGYPFAVNFDHCSSSTVRHFTRHPLCIAWNRNDDPSDPYTEAHQGYALKALCSRGKFDWVGSIDTDELFDRRAPELIQEILTWNVDLVWTPRIELWGDREHYRVDNDMYRPCSGPDQATAGCGLGNLSDKFYNRNTGWWRYEDPALHTPYKYIRGRNGRWVRDKNIVRRRTKLYTIHHDFLGGAEDAKRHDELWETVYRRALGYMPYPGEFYKFAAREPPTELKPFNYDTWDEG